MMNADGLDQASLDIIREGKHAFEPSMAVKNRVRQRVLVRLGSATVVLLATRSMWGMLGKWAAIATAAGATVGGVAYWQMGVHHAKPAVIDVRNAAPPKHSSASPEVEAVPLQPAAASTEPTALPLPHAAMPKPKPNNLAAEISALGAANAAIHRGDAVAARRLLKDYDSKFTSGVLREERAAAEVLLQCALGNQRGAQAAASRFETRFPKSPLRARVRNSCAGAR